MHSRTLQTALVALLLTAGAALAQAPELAELYRKHFAQLPASYHHHLRFLMEDGSRALRVLARHGWIEAPGGETAAGRKEENKEGVTKEEEKMALRQLLTAASELHSVATALQRTPLPPDGHWLAAAQHLKQPAVRLSAMGPTQDPAWLRQYVVKARDACYECHRIYGGPIDPKNLFAQGADRYDEPLPLPAAAAGLDRSPMGPARSGGALFAPPQ